MGSIHPAIAATSVPETAAVPHCTVHWWPQVVVAVIRAEHHAVVKAECIVVGVTRIPSHQQPEVVCLWQHSERTVLGIVPFAAVTWLQVELQLVAAVYCQLTEQFVAEPVVALRVIKTDFKLQPRTVEEVGPIGVLLNHQRNAVDYKTAINVSELCANYTLSHKLR